MAPGCPAIPKRLPGVEHHCGARLLVRPHQAAAGVGAGRSRGAAAEEVEQGQAPGVARMVDRDGRIGPGRGGLAGRRRARPQPCAFPGRGARLPFPGTPELGQVHGLVAQGTKKRCSSDRAGLRRPRRTPGCGPWTSAGQVVEVGDRGAQATSGWRGRRSLSPDARSASSMKWISSKTHQRTS